MQIISYFFLHSNVNFFRNIWKIKIKRIILHRLYRKNAHHIKENVNLIPACPAHLNPIQI